MLKVLGIIDPGSIYEAYNMIIMHVQITVFNHPVNIVAAGIKVYWGYAYDALIFATKIPALRSSIAKYYHNIDCSDDKNTHNAIYIYVWNALLKMLCIIDPGFRYGANNIIVIYDH